RVRGRQRAAAYVRGVVWRRPLAILVCRSRFVPWCLGVWLTINGFAYVAISLTGVLLPQYQDKVFSLSFPALLGELAIMLWLVVKGAKPQPLDAAALSSSAA